jgi:hypothetical protein
MITTVINTTAFIVRCSCSQQIFYVVIVEFIELVPAADAASILIATISDGDTVAAAIAVVVADVQRAQIV